MAMESQVEEEVEKDQESTAKDTKKKGGRHRFSPDENAEGTHTKFRRDPETGEVIHYETFTPQPNSHNPNPWESIRYDGMKLVTNILIKQLVKRWVYHMFTIQKHLVDYAILKRKKYLVGGIK